MQEMTAIPTPQALGVALRAARKRLGLNQADLALAAGVGVRFIVDLEGGKPTVRLEQLLRVVDALGASLALTGLGNPAAAELVTQKAPTTPAAQPALLISPVSPKKTTRHGA
jgi:y4mF family transcriptional regulator